MSNYNIPKSPYDIRDYTITADTEFPEVFSLETVPVKNQGLKPTCTAHALSSVVEYHHKRQHGNYKKFSTEFIYGMREDGDKIGDGLAIRRGLQTLLQYGDTYESDCAGNHDCEAAMRNVKSNFDSLKELAYPHRISAYFKINNADELKTALMKYGVAVVSMYIHKGDRLVKDLYTVGTGDKDGSHCVFVYGWNEKGWLTQNSWGRFYGGDGRFIIPFDFQFREMWGVVDNITDGEFNKPKRNKILDVFYFLLNKILNFIFNLKGQ